MPNLPFTLRQLEVFSILCTTRSFRRAAEALNVTQASVSNQIKALEDQLQVRLFLRVSGKRPSLTAEGLAFSDDLARFDTAAQALAKHRRTTDPVDHTLRLRIRAGQGLMDHFVRPKLDRFLAANPGILLEFDAHPPSENICHDVEAGPFDLALFHLRADHPVDPMFREVALLRGGIYGHRRFAEGEDLPLRPERMNTLPFVLPREGSEQEQEVHLALRRVGITPLKIVGHTQYFDVIANMLEQGLAVASFSDVMLRPEIRGTVILLFPLSNWRLIWFRRDQRDPRLDAVEEFLLGSVLRDPNYPTIAVFDVERS